MNYHRAILSLWAIWLVYWIVSSFGNKRAVYRTNPLWRFAALLIVVGLVAWWRSHPEFFGQRLFPRTEAAALAGTVLCAIGIGFSIWARAVLGRNWSGGPVIKEGHELVQTGPYRLVRHPIYTGILLAVLGSALAGGRVGDLMLFLTVIIMLTLKLRIEESLMQRQFGERYAEYRKRTKALIPSVF
jgi:protein-S-isoprenylcysteine O-methyltransferase Ste14